MWALIVIGTAMGGALVVWHTVSRSKYCSEQMLVKYRELLADARADKAKRLAAQAAEAQAEAERAAEAEARKAEAEGKPSVAKPHPAPAAK